MKKVSSPKEIITYLYKILPWILICLGVFLRLRQYLFNRSLWSDEAALALNIANRSFWLFFQPLDYNQATPIGFLIIEKIIVQIFGNNEFALRLFPFFCGITSLFIFYEVVRRYIGNRAMPAALGLFAIMSSLIYYSSELKQYSSDVLLVLLLYLMGMNIVQRKVTIFKSFVWGFLGASAIWFSYPAVFLLAGICVVSLFYLNRRGKKEILFLFNIFAIWTISFGIYYIVSLKPLVGNEYFLRVLKHTFMPLSLNLRYSLNWLDKTLFDLFSSRSGLKLNSIAALLFVVGCIAMFYERKEKCFLLISPFFFVLLASALHKYPFKGRWILFLIPAIVLFIANGIEQIKIMLWDKSRIYVIIIITLLFWRPVIKAYNLLQNPIQVEEIRPVIEYVVNNKQKGDLLYVYYASPQRAPAFRYYSKRYGFTENDYTIGIMSRKNLNNYVKDLNKLHGNKRVWILFSHVYTRGGVDEDKLFLYHLDSIGIRLDYFKSKGATVYLYDLSYPKE